MNQEVFTCVTPIPTPALYASVERALRTVAAADPDGQHLFGKVPMLHFASVTLFGDAADGLLVLESNIDGSITRYLTQLVRFSRATLNTIYSGLPGYPAAGQPHGDVVEYLERHKKSPQLYHL